MRRSSSPRRGHTRENLAPGAIALREAGVTTHPLARVVAAPMSWGILCFAVAAIWRGEGFVPFLLLLVAGWCAGHTIVRALWRLPSARGRLVAHAGLSILFLAIGAAVTPRWGELLDPLPSALQTSAYLLGMASITMVGWVWLALIGLITSIVTSQGAARVGPEWENDGGLVLRLAAVPAPHRRLTNATVVAGAGGGLAIVLAVIAWMPLLNGGPRLLVLLFGAVALPLYEWCKVPLRAQTQACEVRIMTRALRIDAGGTAHDFAYRDIDELVWCTKGEQARIDVAGRGTRRSLLVGIARQEPGVAATLPPLSGRFRRLLATNGLVEDARRQRHGQLRFTRPPSLVQAQGGR